MAAPVCPDPLTGLVDAPAAAELRAGLDAVERALAAVVAQEHPVIDPSREPWAAPDGRRHALLGLVGARRLAPALPPASVEAAAVAELTYLATCYHASGQVLAGDVLIVRATALVAELPAPTFRVWADALRVVHELALVGRPDEAAVALRGFALALGGSVVGRPQPQPAFDDLVAALTSAAPTAPARR